MMKKFKKIYIEIINRCNLTCGFCPRSNRPACTMSVSFFSEVLRKIKNHTEYLYFHVMGEPLMHPELPALLDISGEHGLKVNITTNGTLIKRLGPALAAKKALRQINFSLHCQNENGPDLISGAYLDDIIAFIKTVRGKNGPIVCLRLWNFTGKDGLSDNAGVIRRIGREFGCADALLDDSKILEGIEIADNVFINGAALFEWPGLDKQDRGETGFCLGLRDQVAIMADGTVVPCCLDAQGEIALGNIGFQALSDIVDGPRATAMHEGFSKRTVVEGLCRKCGYRGRFDLIRKSR